MEALSILSSMLSLATFMGLEVAPGEGVQYKPSSVEMVQFAHVSGKLKACDKSGFSSEFFEKHPAKEALITYFFATPDLSKDLKIEHIKKNLDEQDQKFFENRIRRYRLSEELAIRSLSKEPEKLVEYCADREKNFAKTLQALTDKGVLDRAYKAQTLLDDYNNSLGSHIAKLELLDYRLETLSLGSDDTPNTTAALSNQVVTPSEVQLSSAASPQDLQAQALVADEGLPEAAPAFESAVELPEVSVSESSAVADF